MEQTIYRKFTTLVYEASGIAINDNKQALVAARVGKRVRELELGDEREYLKYLMADETGEEIVKFLDVISTNVTHFFREEQHFDYLREVLPQWLQAGSRRLRIWSAACSSGEEPYTLAMVISDVLGSQSADVKILATDISTRILATAREGEYDKRKIEGVPAAFRERYFERTGRGDAAQFRVNETLREMITFQRLNLSKPPFPMKGPMDAVFCRNVMIYFDNQVRQRLLEEFFRLIRPGGYLFVGHAESLAGLISKFKPVMPSVYVKE